MTRLSGTALSLFPDSFGISETPQWSMPWLAPGPIARQALAVLPHPLHACQTGAYFDAEEFYDQWESERRLRKVEKEIRAAGNRLEWRLERVWAVDDESTPEERAKYEESATSVAGYDINPRCLDDYVTVAYDLMATIGMDEDDPDWGLGRDPQSVAVYEAALDWARAGVVLLQQSLPWPFTGVLPWAVNDNRPAHRAVFVYALLLAARSPKRAKPWFRAMLYMNPDDNMGVTSFL